MSGESKLEKRHYNSRREVKDMVNIASKSICENNNCIKILVAWYFDHYVTTNKKESFEFDAKFMNELGVSYDCYKEFKASMKDSIEFINADNKLSQASKYRMAIRNSMVSIYAMDTESSIHKECIGFIYGYFLNNLNLDMTDIFKIYEEYKEDSDDISVYAIKAWNVLRHINKEDYLDQEKYPTLIEEKPVTTTVEPVIKSVDREPIKDNLQLTMVEDKNRNLHIEPEKKFKSSRKHNDTKIVSSKKAGSREYNIVDIKSKEFINVYNLYATDKISQKEAADRLGLKSARYFVYWANKYEDSVHLVHYIPPNSRLRKTKEIISSEDIISESLRKKAEKINIEDQKLLSGKSGDSLRKYGTKVY